MILLDTNVVVYALDEDASHHRASRAAAEAGFARHMPAVVVPQILVEAYAILTDPKRVTHPMDPIAAWNALNPFRAGLPMMTLTPGVLDALTSLITSEQPSAQDIFDAMLVAQMHHHGIGTLCTYNTRDFKGYPGISAEQPTALLKRLGLWQP